MVIVKADVSRKKILHAREITGDVCGKAVSREKTGDDPERFFSRVHAAPRERDKYQSCKPKPHHKAPVMCARRNCKSFAIREYPFSRGAARRAFGCF